MLPVELWEQLILLVDQPLALAGVCRLLMDLSVREQVRRYGQIWQDLTQNEVLVTPSTLAVLSLYSCANTLAIEALSVYLRPARPSEIFFATPKFRGPWNMLCATLSLVAQRSTAPVLALCASDLFTCNPTDVAEWDLLRMRFNPPSLAWLRRHPIHPYAGRTVATRCHDGQVTHIPILWSLFSVSLSVPRAEENGPSVCSLLLFNPTQSHALEISYRQPPSVSPFYSYFLQNAKLPSLEVLDLAMPVQPAALRAFLEHHPNLQTLKYRSTKALQVPPSANVQSIIGAPLLHPALREIWTCGQEGNPVNGLVGGICMSPALTLVVFEFAYSDSPDTGAGIAPFLEDLRILATRPTFPRLRLQLRLYPAPGPKTKFTPNLVSPSSWFRPANQVAPPSKWWASSEEALQVARSLRIVSELVILTPSRSVARALFPFIAALPALASVHFGLHLGTKKGYPQVEGANASQAFREEVLRLLGRPGVTCVVCEVSPGSDSEDWNRATRQCTAKTLVAGRARDLTPSDRRASANGPRNGKWAKVDVGDIGLLDTFGADAAMLGPPAAGTTG
ncbi:hypothetical protein HMN09_00373600 [Mycena chlorophos]|uniref:Uncharacterized protein n=1 Tax=Mycena chlorophos TaxID=658473 RepID=A0A8H6WNB5_MYCCL|nr:hypothetical protein HMN09_00373600 [Mycena chlorophos]